MRKTNNLVIFESKTHAWIQNWAGTVDIHHFEHEWLERGHREYWALLSIYESYNGIE